MFFFVFAEIKSACKREYNQGPFSRRLYFTKTARIHFVFAFSFDVSNSCRGHFRVAPSLCFKTRLISNDFLYSCILHKKGFALRLVSKLKAFGTRKWPFSKIP